MMNIDEMLNINNKDNKNENFNNRDIKKKIVKKKIKEDAQKNN